MNQPFASVKTIHSLQALQKTGWPGRGCNLLAPDSPDNHGHAWRTASIGPVRFQGPLHRQQGGEGHIPGGVGGKRGGNADPGTKRSLSVPRHWQIFTPICPLCFLSQSPWNSTRTIVRGSHCLELFVCSEAGAARRLPLWFCH